MAMFRLERRATACKEALRVALQRIRGGSSVPPASAQAVAVSRSARSRYGLRPRERKVYTEVEEPQDDDFFFCELCRDFYLGECSVHGPPEFIADAAVAPGVANRARLSLPQGLTVGASSIAGAGLGVWSNRKKLPKGVRHCARNEQEQNLVPSSTGGRFTTAHSVPWGPALSCWSGGVGVEVTRLPCPACNRQFICRSSL
ncbi:histone-lysine N-methyltransferase PRDM9-like, partial [Lethenteron reissneri]|uniref:histone-lysine N-methyltransferase PRDM9-like n=1 Tax=Lethenteron reissneri TaxID=7753 RepID=UPI002AB72E9A